MEIVDLAATTAGHPPCHSLEEDLIVDIDSNEKDRFRLFAGERFEVLCLRQRPWKPIKDVSFAAIFAGGSLFNQLLQDLVTDQLTTIENLS